MLINEQEPKDELCVAVCQINVIAKRPDLNAHKIISFLAEAKRVGADVAVFPENAIPGYMVGDDWEDEAFLRDCASYTGDVFDVADKLGIGAVFGTVTRDNDRGTAEDGRPSKHNQALARIGKQTLRYSKINLPNYREFDDKRYFVPGTGNHDALACRNSMLSLSICEDGWDDDYAVKPIDQARGVGQRLGNSRPHVHINLSCSPFTLGKNDARNRRFAKQSLGFAALIYVNNVGTQNNGKNVFVFDGSSTLYVGGQFVAALPAFEEVMGLVHIKDRSVSVDPDSPWVLKQEEPKTGAALVYGIREFCRQSNISRVVIGLSGGIDSAVSAMLHVRALGADKVIAVNMPTRFNSNTTRHIAATIAERLGVQYAEAPIEVAVAQVARTTDNFVSTLAQHLRDAYIEDSENIQARMRGAGIQAALAGGLKAVFPNNGNKAELSVGYLTLGGDNQGYLAPIADLWKHEVYDLARELSVEMGDVLPDEIFTLPASAELSTDHDVDDGKGDPLKYWYHDRLLASWMQPWNRDNVENTLAKYKDNKLLASIGLSNRRQDFVKLFPTPAIFIADLERWWSLFKGMGVVKRVQSPPILTISRRAYGFDFRESIGSVYYTKRYLELKARLLTTK